MSIRLAVVVPFYNEAGHIGATLAALAAQDDSDFDLVLVDNGSSDGTVAVVESFCAGHSRLRLEIVTEPQKGTGAAADTGFHCAIAAGATHVARTDADCLPARDWVSRIKRAFAGGAEFVAGRICFRSDDLRLDWRERVLLAALTSVLGAVSPLLPHNRGRLYKTRYVMASGGNLALTAPLYIECGGFPRIALEDDNEDRLLVNRARRVTANVRRDGAVVVAQSARRVRRYGIRNAILWYWERRYRPVEVDVR